MDWIKLAIVVVSQIAVFFVGYLLIGEPWGGLPEYVYAIAGGFMGAGFIVCRMEMEKALERVVDHETD